MRTRETARTASVMREIFAASFPSLKLGTASKSGAGTAHSACSEGAIQVYSGADKRQVRESLRKVSEGLA